MAKDLPRFVGTTPITPGPFTSAAPSFEALAQTFGSIQKVEETKLQKFADQEAIIKGEEAGQQPGFRPAKGQGEATRIFNKSALATNQLIVGRQISQHFKDVAQKSIEEFPDANQAIIAYKANTQAYGQQLLTQVPEESKIFTENLLRYHGLTGLSALQKKANAQNQLRLSAEYTETAAQAKNDALAAVDKGNIQEGLTLIGQKRQADKLAEISGKIKKGQADAAFKQDQLDIHKQIAIVQYKQNLQQGKGIQFIQSLENKSFPGMNDQQKTNFIGFLSKVRDEQLQGMGMDKATVAKQAKDQLIAMRHGAVQNLKIRQGVALTGEPALKQYDEDSEDAIQYHQVTTAAISKPLIDQIPYINQFRPTDPNAPDFARRLRNYNAMISSVQKFQNKMFGKNADPVALLQNHPGVVSALNQRANAVAANVTGQQDPNVSVNQKLQDPDEQFINAQIQAGRSPTNVSVLRNDTARTFVGAFKRFGATGQITEQIGMFQVLRAQHPNTYPEALNDVVKKGLPRRAQFLEQVRPDSPLLVEIEQSFAITPKILNDNLEPDKIKAIDKVVNKDQDAGTSNYIESFRGFKSTTRDQHTSAYKNYVRNLAYQINIDDKTLSAQEAVARANETVGGQYNYITVDNQMMRVPLQFNQHSVKAYALQQEKHLRTFDFVLQDKSFGLPNRRKTEFETLIKPGHWTNNSKRDGMIYVNLRGQPVHDPQGNMFQFKFKDAVNNFASDYGTFGYYARSAEQKLNSVKMPIQSIPQLQSFALAQELAKKIRSRVAFPDLLKSINFRAQALGLPPITISELQFESKFASRIRASKNLQSAALIATQLFTPGLQATLNGQELHRLLTDGS